MTSRLGKPDTETDLRVQARLTNDGSRHFIMVAGAGSGKTTSLIKALNHIKQSRGQRLQRNAQEIACITYTDVAVGEISSDVGHDPLFHVSTTHSFLWSVAKPFQNDIKNWVSQQLIRKIADAQVVIEKQGTREATRERERDKVQRYENQLTQIEHVNRFRYGTGSDYENGILGHSDILKLGPALIIEHDLMKQVVAQRFPVIFVDESQDTAPDLVEALKAIASNAPEKFCLGFFGDPIQKVYPGGIGDIACDQNWELIEKPENFRCPLSVLDVINRIRAEADGLQQTRGRMIHENGVLTPVQGTARLFILPADELRAERLTHVRSWLSENNADPLWQSEESEGDVRMLVIVHRMAANRLGFSNLYSALNDRAPENLKSGLIDGTAWIVRTFIRYILPLIKAHRNNDNFRVMELLRQNSPRLQLESMAIMGVPEELESLNNDIAALADQLALGSTERIGDLVRFVHERGIALLDERFLPVLADYARGEALHDESIENSPLRFMQCAATELWGYQTYIEDQSPFSTQQGIKGAEFDRVLVVIDDEENTMNSFSYGKYFGLLPLSDRDKQNIEQGKETVIDRTRRLFYVCCSRAVRDLAVVVFAPDVEQAREVIGNSGYFDAAEIHQLEL